MTEPEDAVRVEDAGRCGDDDDFTAGELDLTFMLAVSLR